MSHALDARLLSSYARQASELPEDLRGTLKNLWGSSPILLYALADLDASHRLADHWVVLGETELVIVHGPPEARSWLRLERAHIGVIQERSALTSTRWRIVAKDDPGRVLAELCFSRRQRRAMENIKIWMEASSEPAERPNPDRVYAEAVAEPIRNAQAAVRGSELTVIRRLLGYLLPYRSDVLIGGFAALMLTALSLVPPRVSGLIIDGLDAPNPLRLWGLVGLLGLAYALRTFFIWLRLRRMAFMGECVAHDIRTQVYSHLQTLSLRFFTRKQTGSIISRCSSDTDRLWDFIAFGVIEVALAVLMLFGLGTVLLLLDWRLGLLMTLPVPLILYAFVRHGRGMQHIFLKAWRKWSDLTSVLSGTIPGIRVVKAFHQEKREAKRLSDQNDECLVTFTEVHKVWTRFWPTLTFTFHAITLGVYFLALPRLSGIAGPPISPGTFVTFLLYAGMFMQPLETIGQMTRMMNRAVSSAHRIFEILDTEPQIADDAGGIVLDPLKGSLRLENVGFSYDGVRHVYIHH